MGSDGVSVEDRQVKAKPVQGTSPVFVISLCIAPDITDNYL
jgi:hypothetical protein